MSETQILIRRIRWFVFIPLGLIVSVLAAPVVMFLIYGIVRLGDVLSMDTIFDILVHPWIRPIVISLATGLGWVWTCFSIVPRVTRWVKWLVLSFIGFYATAPAIPVFWPDLAFDPVYSYWLGALIMVAIFALYASSTPEELDKEFHGEANRQAIPEKEQ